MINLPFSMRYDLECFKNSVFYAIILLGEDPMLRLRDRKDLELFKRLRNEVAYMRIFTVIFFSIAYALMASSSRYFYLPLPFALVFILSQMLRNRIINSPWITILSPLFLNATVIANTGFQRSPFIFLILVSTATQGIENSSIWTKRSLFFNSMLLTFLSIYAFIQRDSFGLAYVSGIFLLMYFLARIIVRNQESILKYAADMEEIANIDPLTGLYNRRALERYSNILISNRNPFTLVMCDLDGFKRYNDVYGHQAGDEALRRFAQLLKESLRLTDLSFRYGGDEFVILLQGEPRSIEPLCDRIREKLKNRINDVGISFGHALFPRDGNSLDKILAIADRALYEAKRGNYNNHNIKE